MITQIPPLLHHSTAFTRLCVHVCGPPLLERVHTHSTVSVYQPFCATQYNVKVAVVNAFNFFRAAHPAVKDRPVNCVRTL